MSAKSEEGRLTTGPLPTTFVAREETNGTSVTHGPSDIHRESRIDGSGSEAGTVGVEPGQLETVGSGRTSGSVRHVDSLGTSEPQAIRGATSPDSEPGALVGTPPSGELWPGNGRLPWWVDERRWPGEDRFLPPAERRTDGAQP